ncbi:putative ubiquitin carboxyl-terminal hydrolase [Triangularia verruculosa]|uniref:ubiquitinyl hydrolase 1 n=1 Tax=Triangularia verruculosa TaxID=2587418 RepID=A0AAN6XQ34_9PEZI|nr:putative ubiquitin carboxyl-terminal hydrolase [Triangularia verruculosa]
MNTDAYRRILGQVESRVGLDPQQQSSLRQLKERSVGPIGVVATIVVLFISWIYQTAKRRGRVPAFSQLVWKLLVTIIPARLLFAMDDFFNPSLFPRPSSADRPATHEAKSDVLKKMLGLETAAGILNSGLEAGRKSLTTLSTAALSVTRKSLPDQPPGLLNMDNSCFQNSILQGLASLKPFPGYLSTVASAMGSDDSFTTSKLHKLILDLNNLSNNGRTLGTPAVLKKMNTWQQQDAQEYFSKLLDQISKEVAKSLKNPRNQPALELDWSRDDSTSSQHSDDSGYHSTESQSKYGQDIRTTRNPLEGLIAQRVACVSCGYCSGLDMIPFNCLTLNLGTRLEHDLYERLDAYTNLEAIQDVECTKCTLLNSRKNLQALLERANIPGLSDRIQLIEEALEEEDFQDDTLKECKIPRTQWKTSTKTKQTSVARPPQSLVFHINRSVFDEHTGRLYKNPANVRFPMELDLGPWCVGSAAGVTGRDLSSDQEEWITDPRASMVAGGERASKITGPIYTLRAVVAHYGRHENGHYVCFRKHPRSSPPTSSEDGAVTEEPPKLASEKDISADAPSTPVTRDTPEEEDREEQWWSLSDEDVTKVDEDTVLAQGGVFMLFYDCVDPELTLTSDIPIADETEGEIKGPVSFLKVTESEAPTAPVEDAPLLEAAAIPLPDGNDSDY